MENVQKVSRVLTPLTPLNYKKRIPKEVLKPLKEIEIKEKLKSNNMSFLSKIFKRKKGGTKIGNLIRGIANGASGGILGNGAMLLKEEERRNTQNQLQLPKYSGVDAINIGKSIGKPLEPMYQSVIEENDSVKKIKSSMVKEWLKNKWWIPVGALVGVAVVVLVFKSMLTSKR